MHFSEKLEIRSRTYFSINHIYSAALFTRLSYNIEKNYGGQFSSKLNSEHRSYVTGAIFSAVAFLEATINEFYMDISDESLTKDGSKIKQQLEQKDIKMISNLWKRKIFDRQVPILDKYQIALILLGKPTFDQGSNPFQDSHYLTRLRNALIHYVPEWITNFSDINEVDPHKFEGMLKGKFNLNPLTGAGNPFYPDKCLGHGCAEWAVKSSIKFVDEFFEKLSATPIFDHIREQLKTK